ncbi:hypothetical protein ACSJL3_005217 (plasmid) [Serratia nevei]|uniref:hypothetical protein n=1 Tax=Serratia nevei TaxID=2703794 RepID=UPI003F6A76C1
MGDWFIATEGVEIVKDSPDLWPQIITGVLSAGAAFGDVWYGQWRITQREKEAAAAKLASERLFIATELVFLLERFAEGCAQVAADQGEPDQQGEYSPAVTPPELTVLDVSGDWRPLPPLIMYRIRELPILQSEARRDIAAASEHSWAPYHKDGFQERQYQYARLGLKALILSRRLRKLTGLPDTRLDATEWSAQPVLWKAWQEERNRRSVQARLRRQTIAQMNVALQQSIKNNSLSGRTP